MPTSLEIIYRDDYLIAINKPHGLLVHPSSIARNADEFALQLLRDQIGQRVYPAHRLDRKTSGVLLFALDKTTNQSLTQQFTAKTLVKKYWAIVRGFTPEKLTIDYALKKDNGVLQTAVTHLKTIQHAEADWPSGKHLTTRYSFIEVSPETGRMHQIRKHLAHIFHPIINDRPHGCNKQNKLWLEKFEMKTMMLHARSLTFTHPVNAQEIQLTAQPSKSFVEVADLLKMNVL